MIDDLGLIIDIIIKVNKDVVWDKSSLLKVSLVHKSFRKLVFLSFSSMPPTAFGFFKMTASWQ